MSFPTNYNPDPDKSLTDLLIECQLDDKNDVQAPQSNDSVSPKNAVCSSTDISVSSNDSLVVSYLHTSQFNSSSEVSQGAITIEETNPNTNINPIPPCKAAQSNDSGSSTNADCSSSDISVSSNDSLVVSCLHTSQFNSSSEVSKEAITIEETTDTDGEDPLAESRPGSTDISMNTSSRLKRHSPDPVGDDLEIKKFALGPSTSAAAHVVSSIRAQLKRRSSNDGENGTPVKKYEMATPSNRSVVTRSGRAVVLRMNQEFDYSSSQSKDDDEEESDDPSLETDDEDYQQTVDFDEAKWSCSKRRSFGNSSNSACSTDGSHSSPESMPPTIYIELGKPVAIVDYEPLADLALEDDGELKTKVHKFLGLMAPRRRLYNPDENCDPEPEENEKVANLSLGRLLNISASSPAKPPSPSPMPLIGPPTSPTSTWSTLNLSHLNPPTLQERQKKMFDNMVLQANATSFEEETPDFLKEPIDLSDLPNKRQVAAICRGHKSCIPYLENHPHFYRFVESLNPATSINFCHPLALNFRQKNFGNCKVSMAKLLFNIFNHAIFHCGLLAPIVWKRGMSTPCKSELAIGASGQRTARILLWKGISHPSMLIKPLLHEMIHAAAFVFNRETGHGDNCRRWAYQAKHAMPELPTIEDCQPTLKYTCTLCARCSYGRIDFPKEKLRCHYCQFAVGVKPYSQADMFNGTRPDPAMTPFKSFIRDNYLKLGEEGGATHSSKMRLLNEEYSKMSVPNS
ncbi:uncharacterized protein LOC108046138 isoform X2 [Drosophila rhopaloa]|uniref:Uncharacterized protein LOC108046138 isoform X2 n=1 Tax=Drosophila rhopaloa TaxID=1041015 RepID=A0A6P4ESQ2_DRORH|nr:uncharacterized protein LOC108046138 isoform X2 [Drosophila rhopaloa]